MNLLRKIDRGIAKSEEFIMGFSIIISAVLLVGNVILRFILNNSLPFVQEIGQVLLIVMTFVGTSFAARKGRHIRMSALFDVLPHRMKKYLMISISALTSITLLIVAFYGVQYMIKLQQIGTVTPSLSIPMYLVILIVPIGLVSTSIHYFRNMLVNIKEKDVYISAEKKDFGAANDLTDISLDEKNPEYQRNELLS